MKRTSMTPGAIIALCFGGLALVGVLSLTAAFVAGFLQGYSGRPPDFGSAVPWVLAPFVAGFMVTLLVVTLVWMRTIDEAAREAHKVAWFWGGLTGLALGGTAVILATLPQASAFQPSAAFGVRDDPAAWMALGACLLAALMAAGYLVTWAWWWITRMGK